MILEHHKGVLDPRDVAEVASIFESCPASHNSYQSRDTTLLQVLFASSAFSKIKSAIRRDLLVCEAWFIVGSKYSWHVDVHVDLFSDHVVNIWIPYDLPGDDDSPVLEYYDSTKSVEGKRRDPAWLLSSLIRMRSMSKKLPGWMNAGKVVDRLFSVLLGSKLCAVENVAIGDFIVLDPSYVHRSGPRKKKVLAIQCVPVDVLLNPNVCFAHSSYTSRVARKALAAIYLQGRQEEPVEVGGSGGFLSVTRQRSAQRPASVREHGDWRRARSRPSRARGNATLRRSSGDEY